MSEYRYRGAPEERAFGPLEPGDYNFVVSDVTEPRRSEAGNLVLGVKLSIQPSGQIVFANPWQGMTSSGEDRDDIAAFLHAINRIPKIGEEPRWQQLVGARGRVRLKVEIAQQGNLAGKSVNKVAFFHRPKQVGPTAEPPRQSFTEGEINESQAAIAKVLGIKDPDLDVAPDDIPF
jgi:hypothetical protein